MKQSFRSKCKEFRKNLDPKVKERLDSSIKHNLSNILPPDVATGLYYPINNEIDLLSLTSSNPEKFCFPKTSGDSLTFCKPDFKGFVRGEFSFEPANCETAAPKVIVVPALGADKCFNRLGYGKGFYDKYLTLNKSIQTICVVYDECLFELLPTDDWDVKMDIIITPTQILERK